MSGALVSVIQSKDSLGITDLENSLNDGSVAGSHMLGSLLDYPNSVSVTASEIQYLRLPFSGGIILDRVQYFLEAQGAAARVLRMGLYDQAVPADPVGVPNNRVAQTDEANTAGALVQFRNLILTDAPTGGSGVAAPYTVPVDGFYWLAFTCGNTNVKFAGSLVYRGNYLPVRRESGVGTVLPAVAGGLSNPQSGLVYTAALEE